MPRYVAVVEYDDGQYWISFPGIRKAYSHAERIEDVVPNARAFLTDQVKYGSRPPPALDDAISEPSESFEGIRLVIFEWEPPARTGYRVVGHQAGELVFDMIVPVEKIGRARELAQVPADDPVLARTYPLTRDAAREIISAPLLPDFDYFLEADR